MKTIGIVRKIDELGRIVIPKEIRKYMCIDEGSPMEIILNDDNGNKEIILRKYESDPLAYINDLDETLTDMQNLDNFDQIAKIRRMLLDVRTEIKNIKKD